MRTGRERVFASVSFGLLAALGVALFGEDRRESPSPLFRDYCARCHGEDGTASTPKGRQLKARDFTDTEWQSARSDADLIKIVTKGGEQMPAFGKKLSRDQIEGLIRDDVRGFGKKR